MNKDINKIAKEIVPDILEDIQEEIAWKTEGCELEGDEYLEFTNRVREKVLLMLYEETSTNTK